MPAARHVPGVALHALAEVTARWRQDGIRNLPAPLADWLLAGLRHRLESAASSDLPPARQVLPPGWPEAGLGAGIGVFDRLEHDCLAALLRAGGLDGAALEAVHETFSEMRTALAARGGERSATQTVQQALAARDRQLSIATHELRTPIASILLNLDLLERTARARGSLDVDSVSRLLAVPSRQLRRLTRMVDLLLDVAQVENERLVLQPEPVDLCRVVHESVSRLAEMAREAGCELGLQGCAPVVGRWDRLRLEQVVTNLVTNAIKYGGGRIEVSTGGDDAEARLTVRDHGSGIAAEDQQRIFEPFERLARSSAEEGAGLGLYIVREIVRAHGGRISIDSRPGAGATFTVHLPVEREES